MSASIHMYVRYSDEATSVSKILAITVGQVNN